VQRRLLDGSRSRHAVLLDALTRVLTEREVDERADADGPRQAKVDTPDEVPELATNISVELFVDVRSPSFQRQRVGFPRLPWLRKLTGIQHGDGRWYHVTSRQRPRQRRGRAARDARGSPSALSANVCETGRRPEFSVEGEQAKAARGSIIEPSPCSPAFPDGSDVQGQEAVFHR
jgi:hypothetical protein